MEIISEKKTRDNFIRKHELDLCFSDDLLFSLRLMKINAGEYLLTQNSQMTHLYCLVEGKLQVERYEINGNRIIFSFEEAFSVIGDLELFLDNQQVNFGAVQAIAPCYLLTLPLNIVQQKALHNTEFLTFICRQLSKKLYHSSILHSQSHYCVEFKLRRYLLFKTQQNGLSFHLEKRDALSAMLGVSTRQLNRALTYLVSINIITLKNKSITILDSEKLAEIKE
ncbi:MAG TPA: transcriptional regulator [Proteus sp.]|nr:transcriptional regulator [Proteus sp. (in: enterobacteria)]